MFSTIPRKHFPFTRLVERGVVMVINEQASILYIIPFSPCAENKFLLLARLTDFYSYICNVYVLSDKDNYILESDTDALFLVS